MLPSAEPVNANGIIWCMYVTFWLMYSCFIWSSVIMVNTRVYVSNPSRMLTIICSRKIFSSYNIFVEVDTVVIRYQTKTIFSFTPNVIILDTVQVIFRWRHETEWPILQILLPITLFIARLQSNISVVSSEISYWHVQTYANCYVMQTLYISESCSTFNSKDIWMTTSFYYTINHYRITNYFN